MVKFGVRKHKIMDKTDDEIEISQLKKEVGKLRLESNLRKSLSVQLTMQKKVADEAKAEAQAKTEQLEGISSKLSKYLSPQIHEQIFSGEQSAEIRSNRKKLTVFFSDIVGFTDISDELESEELTSLLNFYLNEMSEISLKYGGTIDKFIGDAIMVFFGDPDSAGIEEDAKLCVEMALEMLQKMDELRGYWGKNFSLKNDLEIRIGINTGFCTVGNFGSDNRLDYTAVGGAVNLASRLEHLALPGSAVVSEDTFMLVSQFFKFKPPEETDVKGFLRKIKYYGLDEQGSSKMSMLSMKGKGFDLTINQQLFSQKELEELKSSLAEINIKD
jgi:class 3 adenylate cyclase|tara:strand:+ start:58 stop:1044 length:987 start_codon:yes stop_codon:yes gene_type:complete